MKRTAKIPRKSLLNQTFLALVFASILPFSKNGNGMMVPALGAAITKSVDTQEMAAKIEKHIGNPRGICMVIGDSTGDLACQLARGSERTIYVQSTKAKDVETVRQAAETAGFYGDRIFVDEGSLSHLHLADNLIDALVAIGDSSLVAEKEVLRVLRPQGKAWLGDKEIVKPMPPGTDDWSHPYHGPDNNPVSQDQIAKGPYLSHFLSDPRYAPLPQVAVASSGRVFKLFGHIAFKEREEPWLNTLAAFNGYNGTFLWRRSIPAGIMVHRNTLIATPEIIYYGDDQSCKRIDAATGQLIDEIQPPRELAGGTFWKWMALENGILYALLGGEEPRDPVIRMRSDKHGWPWDPLSPGYNQSKNAWGFGPVVMAIDVKSKQIIWSHREEEPVDSRAMCMKNGRLFLFNHGAYLACLDTKTGTPLWKKTPSNAPELFEAMGPAMGRQDWRTNWRTTAYAKCNDKAIYFAGPTIARLLAVSAENGRILWQHPYDNYQLVLEKDAVYGISGQIDNEVSRKFDPLTGKILQEIKLGRRACTRPTGAIDAIFCRANGGSTRLDLESDQTQLVSPMRAQCQDGVNIANGLLYWWPSVCDCNLTLYGVTCLGPAGNFDYSQKAFESERLQRYGDNLLKVAELPVSGMDWPTFRADNTASARSAAVLPNGGQRLWQRTLVKEFTPTAPTTAGGMVFYGGSDGVVRALHAGSGLPAWTAFTGGSIRFPPTLWNGRAFVGSGDGWVYSFEARTGRLLWRFRAAPIERKIPVYGQILSTWPAASGILVQDGTAYVAAGIVNYDGTYVYALDAITGAMKWQNTTSGHLDDTSISGVSVQGNMIIHEGKLWLAGGNVVSPAVYDLQDGKCLNNIGMVHRTVNNNVPASESPRGSQLYLVANRIMVSDQPFYAHPKWKVYDTSVLEKTWVGSTSDRDVAWVNNAKLLCYQHMEPSQQNVFLSNWGKTKLPGINPLWEVDCQGSAAVALANNAIVVAKGSDLIVYNLQNGRPLWAQMLPGTAVPWGLSIDQAGRIVVALEGGQIVCYGQRDRRASN